MSRSGLGQQHKTYVAASMLIDPKFSAAQGTSHGGPKITYAVNHLSILSRDNSREIFSVCPGRK
jgi:hypothetical protein